MRIRKSKRFIMIVIPWIFFLGSLPASGQLPGERNPSRVAIDESTGNPQALDLDLLKNSGDPSKDDRPSLERPGSVVPIHPNLPVTDANALSLRLKDLEDKVKNLDRQATKYIPRVESVEEAIHFLFSNLLLTFSLLGFLWFRIKRVDSKKPCVQAEALDRIRYTHSPVTAKCWKCGQRFPIDGIGPQSYHCPACTKTTKAIPETMNPIRQRREKWAQSVRYNLRHIVQPNHLKARLHRFGPLWERVFPVTLSDRQDIFLWGPTGGDTLAGLARHAAIHGTAVVWIDWTRFALAIHEQGNDAEATFGCLAQEPVVWFDDLVLFGEDDTTRRFFYRIISERKAYRRPTWYATTLSLDEFKTQFGAELHRRIIESAFVGSAL